jgi:hypothetical protein
MSLASIESYKASQRNYAIFSGVLLLWEIIGVDIDSDLITIINIRIANKDAMQYVLISILVYFGLRFTIERIYIKPLKLSSGIEALDFAASHCLGGLALVIWLSRHNGVPYQAIVIGVGVLFVVLCIINIAIRLYCWIAMSKRMRHQLSRLLLNIAMTNRIWMSMSVLLPLTLLMMWDAFMVNWSKFEKEEYIALLVLFVFVFSLLLITFFAPERPWDAPLDEQAVHAMEDKIFSQKDEKARQTLEKTMRQDISQRYGLMARLWSRLD